MKWTISKVFSVTFGGNSCFIVSGTVRCNVHQLCLLIQEELNEVFKIYNKVQLISAQLFLGAKTLTFSLCSLKLSFRLIVEHGSRWRQEAFVKKSGNLNIYKSMTSAEDHAIWSKALQQLLSGPWGEIFRKGARPFWYQWANTARLLYPRPGYFTA